MRPNVIAGREAGGSSSCTRVMNIGTLPNLAMPAAYASSCRSYAPTSSPLTISTNCLRDAEAIPPCGHRSISVPAQAALINIIPAVAPQAGLYRFRAALLSSSGLLIIKWSLRKQEVLHSRDSVAPTSGATQRCLSPGFSERIGNSRRTGAPLRLTLHLCASPRAMRPTTSSHWSRSRAGRG
jgi:hypothetical protein